MSTPHPQHRDQQHPDHQELDHRDNRHDLACDVIVVGAGLAGLTAAAVAAREGARTVVVDSRRPGGRARSTERTGVSFNQGPHALYRGGAGSAVLASLGIVPGGAAPLAADGRALAGDRLEVLPVGAASLVRTKLVGARAKVELAQVLGRVPRLAVDDLQGATFGAWLDDTVGQPASRALLVALARVATYVDAPEPLPATLAVGQLKLALVSGVSYLHGGWQAIVDALSAVLRVAGGTIVSHDAVVAVEATSGGYTVSSATGESWRARSVVLAAGGPDATGALVGAPPPAWAHLGRPVTASCLDLATERPADPPVIFGIDRPLYLSQHARPARLGPDGVSVVHVMRYGEPDTGADAVRAELHALAARAGLGADSVLDERYLHRMVVAQTTPGAAGLEGRPPVAVEGADGLFVAGDWVGPVGWLADGSLASGQAAGLLAAAHATVAAVRPAGR